MRGQPWHKTRPHARLPPSFLDDGCVCRSLTSQLNVALIRNLVRSLMFVAHFLHFINGCLYNSWWVRGLRGTHKHFTFWQTDHHVFYVKHAVMTGQHDINGSPFPIDRPKNLHIVLHNTKNANFFKDNNDDTASLYVLLYHSNDHTQRKSYDKIMNQLKFWNILLIFYWSTPFPLP